jgi:hypothetical protein
MLTGISLKRITSTYSWQPERTNCLEKVEAIISRGDPVGVYQDAGRRDWWQALGGWPHSFERLAEWPHESARWRALLIISDRVTPDPPPGLEEATLILRPPTLAVGVGCRRGIPAEELEDAVSRLFTENRLSFLSLTAVASAASRKNELGLTDFADERRIPLLTYAADKLALARRANAASAGGGRLLVAHACEPAAMLAAGVRELLIRKTVFPRLTLAVARRSTG